MASTYKLVLEDGTPADPSTFAAAVPNWFDAMTGVHKLPHL